MNKNNLNDSIAAYNSMMLINIIQWYWYSTDDNVRIVNKEYD